MMIQAGDYEQNTGEGGQQLFDYDISSEYYNHPCDTSYLMCVERESSRKNASQFLFTTTNLSYMKDKFIVIGQVTKGKSILNRIERGVPTVETTGQPTLDVVFTDCGVLEEGCDDGVLDKTCVEEGDVYPQYPADEEESDSLYKKLEIAEKLKELGNHFFKQNDLQKAVEKYEKAFRYLAPGLRDDSERKLLEEKELILLGNIAAVKIKQAEHAAVIELCCKILQLVEYHKDMEGIQGIETKAKFRRGVSYFNRGDWLNSYVDLSDLKEKNPNNKEIESWLYKAKVELERYEKKEKHTYSKLFQDD
ncbi:hypothetical protein C9374_011577 [Naegleria lovaniensis]|uniref:peptidylprolyl isomerase n=1 Tax=Naegleria lovaniensis TaxID=51637 RepID=A0AA88KIG9_NAELO|nr:uncharacterized protein C9374_011577 [Naegleria lovaniensis]KAG2373912.1 hypothetical protein C9374_011577 [Naegleria lovaniensis]